jgi:hypothetical protein
MHRDFPARTTTRTMAAGASSCVREESGRLGLGRLSTYDLWRRRGSPEHRNLQMLRWPDFSSPRDFDAKGGPGGEPEWTDPGESRNAGGEGANRFSKLYVTGRAP